MLLHGQMRPREKAAAMEAFAAGEADVLVATTVIEVGIDVPNATVMLVEDAERYGISQLHQLRGRVGRGEHESLCLLFGPEGLRAAAGALREHRDGFRAGRDRPRAARRGRAHRHAPVRAWPRFRFARLPEDAELLVARARPRRGAAGRGPRASSAPEHALLREPLERAAAAARGGGVTASPR